MYQRKYRESHPWAKNWFSSKSRAKQYGWEHTLSIRDFEQLWKRDNAHLLKRPSIDRLDTSKGYIPDNCRFIELKQNILRGITGRPAGKKQRETSSQNLKNWHIKRAKNNIFMTKITEVADDMEVLVQYALENETAMNTKVRNSALRIEAFLATYSPNK
jgi:hypothetical protein